MYPLKFQCSDVSCNIYFPWQERKMRLLDYTSKETRSWLGNVRFVWEQRTRQ